MNGASKRVTTTKFFMKVRICLILFVTKKPVILTDTVTVSHCLSSSVDIAMNHSNVNSTLLSY